MQTAKKVGDEATIKEAIESGWKDGPHAPYAPPPPSSTLGVLLKQLT